MHVPVVMRFGLAIVFGWFGIDKFLNVANWYGWIPGWLPAMPQDMLLYALGAIEVVLALMLIGGRFVRLAGLLCAIFLLAIVLSFGINEITIRDIGLIALALALAMMPEPRKFHELNAVHKLVKRHGRR